jgi:hypothetical protein
MKFYENPSGSGSGQADDHETNSCFSQYFAKAPKMHTAKTVTVLATILCICV